MYMICTFFSLFSYHNRLTPKPVPRLDETFAARRLLEALRQSHKTEDDSIDPTVQTVKKASFDFGMTPKNDANDLKRKQMTLRASLESLLVEYLRGLAPDDDGSNEDHFGRIKRNAANPLQNNDHNIRNENSDTENVNSSNVHEEIHVRNNKYDRNYTKGNAEIDDRTNRATNASRSVCPERGRRTTQLDRNELAAAIQNVPEHEHNIRSLLNYRYLNRFGNFIII